MAEYSSSQDSLISSFMSITGVDKERSIFFLQSAAWNLDAAVGTFYDDTTMSSDHSSEAYTAKESESGSQLEHTPAIPETGSADNPKPTQGRSGFATLSDYKDKPTPSSGEDAQQFYAGGSEHSGQMIEGPPRKKQTPDSIAKEVFEAAKKHGAVDVEEEERERKRENSAAFHGAGFRLGDEEGPSHVIGRQQPLPPKPEMVRHVLTFWRDGFSVDDGPLRTGNTDEDKSFIAAVRKGEIPQELMKAARGGEVDVDIRDKREEAYVRPKPKMVAFSGEGRKLGSYAPEVVSHSPSTSSSASSSAAAATPPPTVPLDPDQPTTTLQIRLADGTRLVSKFNHSHTVNDIRQFINMSRPSSATYVLMTTFPNRELSDPTLTLSQANLLNAVIVQRIR